MSTRRDYAAQDPRSFHQWLRTGMPTRSEPERSLVHPDFKPTVNESEAARLTEQSERAWRMARLGR